MVKQLIMIIIELICPTLVITVQYATGINLYLNDIKKLIIIVT